MGCGCKKKKDAARAARGRTINKIIIVEGQAKVPPELLNPPPLPAPPNDVDHIVNKLNDILKPN